MADTDKIQWKRKEARFLQNLELGLLLLKLLEELKDFAHQENN